MVTEKKKINGHNHFSKTFWFVSLYSSGTKTPENLREKLTRARKSGDKDTLERVLGECVAAGMPELDADIEHARDALDDMDDFVGQRKRGQI